MKILGKQLPTLIILTISILAALSGFLQTQYVREGADLQKELSALRYQRDESQNYANYIIDRDVEYLFRADENIVLARNIAIEYAVLAPTLSAAESQFYVTQIVEKIEDASQWIYSTYVWFYGNYFAENPGENEIIIVSKEEIGFDLIIDRERWELYMPAYQLTMVELLEGQSFHPEVIPEILAHPRTPLGFDYAEVSLFENVFWEIFTELETQISQLETQLSEANALASRYALGTSITTVSIVLVGAISNRRGGKEAEYEFSVIRADIQKDNKLIVSGEDKISIPILIAALIISVIGLLFPLIISILQT